MSHVQAVIFDNDVFKSENAREWLKKHYLRPIKPVHLTENYWRYRIQEPNYEVYRYITHTIDNGIKFIIGFRKK